MDHRRPPSSRAQAWGGTDREFARAELVGYLVLSPLIPIGSWWWTSGDRTRIGSAIVVVVGLVMPVLVVCIQKSGAAVADQRPWELQLATAA